MENKPTTEREKYEFCKQVLDFKYNIERDLLHLGEMLYRIKEERMYEAGWSSWEEYEMELKMSSSTISKLINIYRLFVLIHKFTQKELAEAGGWSIVAELLPVVSEKTPRKEIKELLDMCAAQTKSDVRKSVKDVKRGSPCKHPHTHKLVLEICDECFERWDLSDNKKS